LDCGDLPLARETLPLIKAQGRRSISIIFLQGISIIIVPISLGRQEVIYIDKKEIQRTSPVDLPMDGLPSAVTNPSTLNPQPNQQEESERTTPSPTTSSALRVRSRNFSSSPSSTRGETPKPSPPPPPPDPPVGDGQLRRRIERRR